MSKGKTKLQKYSAPALEKGLDILEYLSLTSELPTLSQIAAGIGRSKNEIFRMMIVLEERGYIQREEGEFFSLTDRLAQVGGTRSDESKLAELANPYLEQLSDATSLSNHLSVMKKSDLLTIAISDAASSYGLSVRVGHRHEVFGTAAGACFMASYANPAAQRGMIADIGAGRSAAAIKAFEKLTETCSVTSLAQAENPDHSAILELAVPVRQTFDNTTVAAITIPIIKSAESPNRITEIADHLKQTARSLQERVAISFPGRLQFEGL